MTLEKNSGSRTGEDFGGYTEEKCPQPSSISHCNLISQRQVPLTEDTWQLSSDEQSRSLLDQGTGSSPCSKSARGPRVHVGQNLTPRLQKHFGFHCDDLLFSVMLWYLLACPERPKFLHHFMFRCQPEGCAQRNATTPSHPLK